LLLWFNNVRNTELKLLKNKTFVNIIYCQQTKYRVRKLL